MAKKITVTVSFVLALALVFACGYYVGQVDADTVEKNDGKVVISQDMYDLLLKYMRLDEIEEYIGLYFIDDYDQEGLLTGAAKGMVYSLGDIYADYYTAEEYQELMREQQGNYSGIGVRMTEDATDGVSTVINVFKNSPALEAGMQPGDRIVGVDGEDVRGLSLTEITTRVRGEDGTSVGLTIQRGDQYIEMDVMRAQITANNVEYRMIGDKGYIKINAFEGDCLDGFTEAVALIESSNATGLILDLRYNGGGLVDYAVKIADRLLPEGVVVYTEDKYGNREEERSDNKYLGLPLVVLVNGYSASASEILAGAIQDFDMGELVGEQTFGKGIVQGMISLKDGAALKITIANYYTPNGRNIHGEGLTPDYMVENSEEANQNPYLVSDEDDAQLQKALELLGQ
ncbi:MAG: S41 family peptidase [Christensenellales bacterium]|jgi:carboxyl-terminal processing protease